jgi:hypothetical protein
MLVLRRTVLEPNVLGFSSKKSVGDFLSLISLR